MVALKTPPAGIDISIQALQQDLYEGLLAIWGLQPDDYEAYGRCYKTMTDKGFIPEVYRLGNDYKEVFLNDRIAVLSFFGTSGKVTVKDGLSTTDVHLIFYVNLNKIKNTAWIPDEEARIDVFNIVEQNNYDFTLTEQITGIDNVFKEYTAWNTPERIKFKDMRPNHFFRFNFSLTYDNDICSFPIN